MAPEESIQNYNKLNELHKTFWRKIEISKQLSVHNVLSQPASSYGSETWVLRARD
jgi:hypothetical protein